MLSVSLIVPTIVDGGTVSTVVSPWRLGTNAYLGNPAIFSSGLNSLSEYTNRACFDLSFLVGFSSVASAGLGVWSSADTGAAPGVGVLSAPDGPGVGTACPICICCIWYELTCGAPKLGRWGRLGAVGRLPDRGVNPGVVCGDAVFWGTCGCVCCCGKGEGVGVVPKAGNAWPGVPAWKDCGVYCAGNCGWPPGE